MPPVKPINVLVYAALISGTGTTADSVRHCLHSFRRLLSPHFAVSTVTAEAILKEPWMSSCALLVIPGGADLPYCKEFNGAGNRKISQYVRQGGAFIGFCAGGYYASKRCEFEPENTRLAVVGSRELAFFPDTCRGAAFTGFQYGSESGARAAKLAVHKMGQTEGFSFRTYFNGGGVFVDAEKYRDRGVEVLASYEEDLDVDGGDGKAAVVYCKFGDGGAILTGPHPEFVGAHLNKSNCGPEYAEIVDAVIADEEKRLKFLRSMLAKLGLKVSETNVPPPRLSRVHLTALHPPDVAHLVDRLQDIITTDGEGAITEIVEENDTFVLHQGSPNQTVEEATADPEDDSFIDYNKVPKHLYIHSSGLPSSESTPFFNHNVFYESLQTYRSQSRFSPSQFGTFMLYGETVTSTNTLLDKNPRLLTRLPNGLTFAATTQVAGRGRGNNVWIAPPGCMIFSTIIQHHQSLASVAPVVFIQYLVGLALVEGVKSYAPGYESMPVRLKWPNDIYARDPSAATETYVKIGGILVNSSYQDNQFHLVVGAGINTHNAAPTTSLSALGNALPNASSLAPLVQERLLARVLVTFEELYLRFCRSGWEPFEAAYYRHWLHSGQVVTLEMEGGARGRVVGVSRDWGLLKVEELRDERPTGKVWSLMSDGNSFDFFRGLLKRKT
ncbi:biotin-protein ligase [Sphaerosporella brunnea]|uniref:Biotin-protein ligase n=1 Tax=Sphaerosporella brunnea TaxID=1250544 RepID=A0A5J5EPL1_9PEZI|nr:biotin-protein ligase [Sphaerosporella brunnea]